MNGNRHAQIVTDFNEVGHDMFLAGLVGSHSGNMSVLADGQVVITRSGARLGRLAADDLVEFQLSGWDIPDKASSEVSAHLEVYATSDHLAVIHAHPANSIAVSLLEDGAEFMPPTLEACYYMPRVPIVDALAGKAVEAAADEIARKLVEHRVVIARGHGTYSAGASLEEAFQWTSVLEDACNVALALNWARP